MVVMKLPYFENEAAEAQWWYDHRDEVSDHLVAAMREGRKGEGTMGRYARKMREAEAAKTVGSGSPLGQAEDAPQHSSK